MRSPRMDPEKTAPFEVGQGEHPVLLLHGFTGSPWDLRPLGDYLAGQGFRAKAIRLPGHGVTAEALAAATHRDWEQASEDALLSLSARGRIYVAGLSMGALLTLRLAARYPEKIAGIALLAPALRFRDPRMRLVQALNGWPVLPILRPHLEKSRTDIADPEVLAQAPILPRVPTARFEDLVEIQRQADAAIPGVRAPTLVIVSRQDHVVRFSVGRELKRRLKKADPVRLVELNRSFHILTRDLERDAVLHEVGAFFDTVRRRDAES